MDPNKQNTTNPQQPQPIPSSEPVPISLESNTPIQINNQPADTSQSQIPMQSNTPSVIDPAEISDPTPVEVAQAPPLQTPPPQQPIIYPTEPTQSAPVQQPVSPQVQQPTGFVPAGFEQANFMQDNPSQTGPATAKKKSFFSNKLLIIGLSLGAFVVVLGGAFAYNKFWVEDKSDLLISFEKLDSLRFQHRFKVEDRLFPNVSVLNETYSLDDEKLRQKANTEVYKEITDEIAVYEESLDDYNSLRDPDFGKLANQYLVFVKKCTSYTAELNNDLNKMGPHISDIRDAIKQIDSQERSFNTASKDQQLQLIIKTKADYLKIKEKFTKEKFKTIESKNIHKAILKQLNENLAVIDDVIRDFNDPTKFVFVGNATKFYGSDDFSAATKSIGTQLNDGVCSSKTDNQMGDVFDKFEFGKDDKEILKTLEVLE